MDSALSVRTRVFEKVHLTGCSCCDGLEIYFQLYWRCFTTLGWGTCPSSHIWFVYRCCSLAPARDAKTQRRLLVRLCKLRSRPLRGQPDAACCIARHVRLYENSVHRFYRFPCEVVRFSIVSLHGFLPIEKRTCSSTSRLDYTHTTTHTHTHTLCMCASGRNRCDGFDVLIFGNEVVIFAKISVTKTTSVHDARTHICL